MIKQLTLGTKTFPINIIQGPLAGVSAAPFRVLTSHYTQPAFSYTEMISCKTILQQDKKILQRFIYKDPQEGPVAFQLSSNNPHELSEAVKFITDAGADLIDLNCGCPVKKIRSRGAGSSLLTRPQDLFQLITAMKKNTHVPISIKIRVDHEKEKFNAEIANVVRDAGADFLIVHGRHWTEHYETPCRYDAIQFFVDALSIPVIGNGDVHCFTSMKKMFATGCAGIMIARAGVGQPWLITKLVAEYHAQAFTSPTLNIIANLFIEHAERLIHLLQQETPAILQMRKLAKYYARTLATREAFCDVIQQCKTFSDLREIVRTHFSE